MRIQEPLMEPISSTFLTFGVILLMASWVQLLINSFKADYSWGLTTLFLPPLSYIYGFFAWEKSAAAIVMAAIGWVLVFLGLN